MQFDIAIIGGGIVGAATFYQLQKKNPTLKIALFEKENILANHQTGHNSGVLHSGLYYKPGSLKAKNCIEGKREMISFAKEYGIAHDICGKVVVASNKQEIVRLEKIHQTGIENKIEGIERISSDQVKEIEPFVECLSGLWVPSTGIIDFSAATKKMIELALALQAESRLFLAHLKIYGFLYWTASR
jgi:(S)-2-hydroxyglutarate dehydrogenase